MGKYEGIDNAVDEALVDAWLSARADVTSLEEKVRRPLESHREEATKLRETRVRYEELNRELSSRGLLRAAEREVTGEDPRDPALPAPPTLETLRGHLESVEWEWNIYRQQFLGRLVLRARGPDSRAVEIVIPGERGTLDRETMDVVRYELDSLSAAVHSPDPGREPPPEVTIEVKEVDGVPCLYRVVAIEDEKGETDADRRQRVTHRDDLTAAHARIAALELEVADLRENSLVTRNSDSRVIAVVVPIELAERLGLRIVQSEEGE
jgi:hypothetical protein